jgi:hypothetical protein
MKNILNKALALGVVGVVAVATASCSDSKTYAELLTDENKYVNSFLADQRVTNTIPTDTTFVFETGTDAPYYRLDEDGNIYMQVVKLGTPGNYATDDEVIYFRFTRYALSAYSDGELPDGEGNESDMSYANCWFRYNNYTLESTYQWGSGIQTPLKLVPIDSQINLVVKSQYGVYDEMSYVVPYLYKMRYYKLKT